MGAGTVPVLWREPGWQHANPGRARLNKRKSYERNIDKYRQRQREARAKNPEKTLAQRREFYARHKERLRAEQRMRYMANPGPFTKARRRWEKANPDAVRAKKLRRRGRDYVTSEHLRLLREALGDRCLRCGSGCDVCWDHVVPLAAGGSGGPLNLQPLCRSCNSSKGHKTSDDHRTEDQKRLIAALVA